MSTRLCRTLESSWRETLQLALPIGVLETLTSLHDTEHYMHLHFEQIYESIEASVSSDKKPTSYSNLGILRTF